MDNFDHRFRDLSKIYIKGTGNEPISAKKIEFVDSERSMTYTAIEGTDNKSGAAYGIGSSMLKYANNLKARRTKLLDNKAKAETDKAAHEKNLKDNASTLTNKEKDDLDTKIRGLKTQITLNQKDADLVGLELSKYIQMIRYQIDFSSFLESRLRDPYNP